MCLLALFANAADKKPAAKKGPPKSGGLVSVRDRYVKAFFKRFPVVGTYLGADGLDPSLASMNGALRDYSPAALHAEHEEWTGFLSELKSKKPTSRAEEIDAEVMRAQLAFLLRNLDRRVHERALDVYLEEPFRGTEWLLQGMTPTGASTYGTAAEWGAVANRVGAIPAYFKTALANVKRGAAGASIPDRRMIRVSVDAAQSTIDYYEKSLPEKAASWMLPSMSATKTRLEKAASEAAAAYREFKQGLLSLYFQPDGKTLKPEFDRDRFAVGEAEYSWALKNNLRLDKTPRELFAYGKTQVAKTQAKMTTLAKEIAASKGFADDSVAAVLKKLGDDVPKSDAEMLAWYQDACRRLVEYGRKTGMFDPPADYKLDVIFTPPPLRDTIDAAYYPAPPLKKTGVGQFYVTPTGDDPAQLRQHARAAIADLAAHEGFPGHDWYYQFMRARSASISPVRWLTPGGVEDSASMWEDSMSAEGWALYCEELVGEPRGDVSRGPTSATPATFGYPTGFYTPEERLFQLQNQLLRDARVVVDTGIHASYMTFDEAVSYLAKNVLFVAGPISTDPAVNADASERAGVDQARKAIYRYSKWPTQAITYHLGKAQIQALRDEVRQIEGAAFDERRFHEEFLSQGTIPPGVFKDVLLDAARKRATPAN